MIFSANENSRSKHLIDHYIRIWASIYGGGRKKRSTEVCVTCADSTRCYGVYELGTNRAWWESSIARLGGNDTTQWYQMADEAGESSRRRLNAKFHDHIVARLATWERRYVSLLNRIPRMRKRARESYTWIIVYSICLWLSRNALSQLQVATSTLTVIQREHRARIIRCQCKDWASPWIKRLGVTAIAVPRFLRCRPIEYLEIRFANNLCATNNARARTRGTN